MTPNHRDARLRREAREQWQGIIEAALRTRYRVKHASARSIDAERSKRRGVPRQMLSYGEMFWLGLVVVAVLASFTGAWL